MIKIEESDSITSIISTVSDFCDSMGYCEHKIPFHIEGVKPPQNLETIQGTMAHEKEEELEKEQFEFVPITQEELSDMTRDVEFARENISTRLVQPIRIGLQNVVVILCGRVDKIFRNDQMLVVQDDKFPTNLKKYENRFEPFDDQKLQALTYLNSQFANNDENQNDWFEIPHKEKAWIIQIRNKSDNNKPFKIFKGVQNETAAKFLYDSIHRFALLILDKEERQHHGMASKCKPCRLFNQCKFRLEQK